MPRLDRTTLYLIRHGATASNERVPPILQGSNVDSTLSPLGIRQARETGRFLSEVRLDAVFSSPMARAVATAEAIADPHGLSVSTLPELHEINVGQWEGMDWSTISRQMPEAYQRFMNDSGNNGYLGGESYRDVLDRILPVFRNILSSNAGRHIAVVAHKAVNRSMLANLLELEMRQAKDLPQENCCINIIIAKGSRMKLKTMNSAMHLETR